MATYIIGDIHGCYETLQRLLRRIEWAPGKDRLVLTGDLVNGPNSLEVLRWAREHGIETVLGNHDLHFLAVLCGTRSLRRSDSLVDVLGASDRDDLADWLRRQSMLIRVSESALVVHAGLLPQWTPDFAADLAREVEEALRGEAVAGFLETLFGNEPRRWSEELAREDRRRLTVNAMTRMRAITPEGRLDLDYKGTRAQLRRGYVPWFDAPDRASRDFDIFFGHWAALGLYRSNGVMCLDSGCVWGKRLTAVRLEDRQVFQEESERAAVR